MKKIIIICSLAVLSHCLPAQHQKHDANKHMHKNSTSSLIKAFNNPQRDRWQKPDLVIKKMGDLSDKTVMDLGAGPGYFTIKLAEHAKKVIAAEPNQEFLDHIEEQLDDEDCKAYEDKIELRKIPYDNAQLAPAEVDYILLVNAYHHVKDRVNYFKNAKEGLKQDGKLFIVDYTIKTKHGPPKDHKLAASVALDEIKKAGYNVVEYDTTTLPRQYIIIAAKK
jgi:cyclopropane fatty-acyl-phospholipid synthase-like methyltransferase